MYRGNVGVQFVLSLSAIFATFALSNQLKYWNTTEALGKNVENVYDLRPDIYSAAKSDVFKDSLFLILDSAGNLPCVEKACLYTSYGGTLPTIYKRKYVSTNIYYMTFASILLAISGVFGIVSLSCERRRKEIAIRKVNGAKLPDIMRLFLSEYMYMLLAAAVIVFPIGYHLVQKWSANYLAPAPIYWWVYPLLFFTFALVIIASVFWQIYKAGTENPSEVMKSE